MLLTVCIILSFDMQFFVRYILADDFISCINVIVIIHINCMLNFHLRQRLAVLNFFLSFSRDVSKIFFSSKISTFFSLPQVFPNMFASLQSF